MLAAIISPAVVAVFLVCVTLLILVFRLTHSSTKEYNDAVDQLIEDHQVFHEGLESNRRKLEEIEKKVTNIAVSKFR